MSSPKVRDGWAATTRGARGVGMEEVKSERFAGPGADLDAKVQNETATLARGAEQSTVGSARAWR